MGFFQEVYDNLEDKDYMGNWGKLRHAIQKTGYPPYYGTDSSRNVIIQPSQIEPDSYAHKYAMMHERIHQRIAESSFINIAYREMIRIYEILVNCFLDQHTAASRKYRIKHGLLIDRLTRFSMKFIYENIPCTMQEMSTDKQLVTFCEYALEYHKKCALLLECTQLIHEATATWCALHCDYSNEIAEEEMHRFHAFLHQKEDELLSQDGIHSKAYRLVCQHIQSATSEQLISIAILALSPPEASFEFLHRDPRAVSAGIHEKWNCLELWKQLLDSNCSPCDRQKNTYEQVYCNFYGEPPKPLADHFRCLWIDKTTMDIIRLIKPNYTGSDIMGILESKDYVQRKPMPFTETKKIIQNTYSEADYKKQTITYYKQHRRTWGAPWNPDPTSNLATDYNENLKILLDIVTSMMTDIVSRAKEAQ